MHSCCDIKVSKPLPPLIYPGVGDIIMFMQCGCGAVMQDLTHRLFCCVSPVFVFNHLVVNLLLLWAAIQFSQWGWLVLLSYSCFLVLYYHRLTMDILSLLFTFFSIQMHKGKREFLRGALKEWFHILSDKPGLLGPKVSW